MGWGEADKLRRRSEAEATQKLKVLDAVKELTGKVDNAVKAQSESDNGDSFRKRGRN